jgi:hypothetical protein
MTSYPLRQLDAQLEKVVTITTTEIEQDDPATKGQYVFRDDSGDKFMWGPNPQRYQFHDVATVAEADHVMFLCPLCFEKNGGEVGTHSVMVTFAGRNVPDEAGSRGKDGKPTRWSASGTSIDDLVLTPSIQLNGGCAWHGFVGSSGIPPGRAG